MVSGEYHRRAGVFIPVVSWIILSATKVDPRNSTKSSRHITAAADTRLKFRRKAEFLVRPPEGGTLNTGCSCSATLRRYNSYSFMDGLSSSVEVLTAMITPAVLISASGTMILSTSTRLGRVVDRVRSLSDRLQSLPEDDTTMDHIEEKRAMIYDQLDKLTSRSRLLQRGLTTFYLAVGIFVATSVSIGVVSLFHGRFGWVPVAFGLVGASFLFYGSMLLVFEARLALSTTHAEMDFIWRTTKRLVPRELVEQHKPHHVHFRRKKD